MKTFIALSALLATSAFGAAPSGEMMRVTRALVNSPEVVAALKKNNSDHLRDFRILEQKQGVTKFVLTFDRMCECVPSTATVSITEDLTPTYHDGAAIYESSIEIEEGK